LVQALTQSARAVETRTGVTNAQLFLLRQIRDRPNITVNELAARAMSHQSTVSIVLSRLERRGLIARAMSKTDRRSVVLRLTTAGARLLRRAPTPATSEILDALQRLTPAELSALSRGLRALGREFGVRGEQPPMLFEEDGLAKPRRAHAKARQAKSAVSSIRRKV
jgi:DNA-binding MarR family transcriptional regulator